MTNVLEYNDWIQSLEEKAEKLPKYQARFSNFEVLPRLGKILSVKSKICADCNVYWIKLQDSTQYLEYFFDDGNRYSIDFDNLVKEIFDHLKSHHNIRPKGFVLSVYALSGMIMGVLAGILFGYLFLDGEFKGGVVLGWLLGVMGGWFLGKIKENKMRKANQLF